MTAPYTLGITANGDHAIDGFHGASHPDGVNIFTATGTFDSGTAALQVAENAITPDYALGTLTGAGNAQDGSHVTIALGATVEIYDFVTALIDAGDILIGAGRNDSLDNLAAAINADPAGAGTVYHASTPESALVNATRSTSLLVVESVLPGVVGNSIATTDDVTSLAWGAGTLAGGEADDDVYWTAVSDINGNAVSLTSSGTRPFMSRGNRYRVHYSGATSPVVAVSIR